MAIQKVNRSLVGVLTIACLSIDASGQSATPPDLQWFKGNTHAHTWWSDGDSPPELVVRWYKEHGYNFLMLSDHNLLSTDEKWVVPAKEARLKAAETCEKTFPKEWIVKRARDGKTEYKLKTLTEIRPQFEEPGKFLLLQGEEISDAFQKKPVHVCGVNLEALVKPQHGESMFDTMQNNINAVLEQRRRTGQPMFAQLNHPNFHWANPVEDIMRLRGEKCFEIHNGHPSVNNYGDRDHLAVERMWDIILTHRLTDLNLGPMYGLATDDAHNYTAFACTNANPGRGWIAVRAPSLTPANLITAIENGDFYASTGVVLEQITFQHNSLSLRIQPRKGVSYTTRFLGTLSDFNAPGTAPAPGAPADATNPNIGKLLAEESGLNPSYRLTGREIYVRAKVISTARHPNPFKEGDVEVAWVQPVQPQK